MSTPDATLSHTIHATLDGWPVDVQIAIAPARLGAALARLAELGYTPRLAAAPAPAEKAARPKADPVYRPDGTPCCPAHQKPLAEGRFGLYCTAKAKDGELADAKGYCGLKFAA
jgi:hypothetical protein